MRNLFLLSVYLLLYTSLKAQDCTNFLGTKTLYKTPNKKLTTQPAGYQPVFINYVGRHGARHLTKEVNSYYCYSLLLQADSLNSLTDAGKQLKQMVLLLAQVEKGKVKSISAEGRQELAAIAERIRLNNEAVFKNNPKIQISITKETRTKQSAEAFLAGLNQKEVQAGAGKFLTDDTNLRFYDASPAYDSFVKNGNWIPYMQALKKATNSDQLYAEVTTRIFKIGFLKQLNPEEKEKFVNDLFGFSTIVYSLQKEIAEAGLETPQLDFKKFFTCNELYQLGKIDVADDYYKKGPGINATGIQVKIAVPLLVNFIKTTDNFLATSNVNVILRFAHAETIAPFAALLDITIADKATTDIGRVNLDWKASEIAPLSSNIQWIIYRKNDTNNYLIKVLLNEEDAHINGLSNKDFPYYNWKDLRKLYTDKLTNWKVDLNDDMQAYLTNLKN